MGNAAKATRQNRTLTVDFHDETTYFALLDNTKAFVEFILAFILSIGFQLNHKSTCNDHIPPNYVVNGWDGYAETA
jgi:hypothetical protein